MLREARPSESPTVGGSTTTAGAESAARPRWLARLARLARLASVLRPLPLVVLVCWWMAGGSSVARTAMAQPDLSRALSLALAESGLGAEPSEIHWLDAPGGVLSSRVQRPRALLRAAKSGEPADIFLAAVRLSPEGRLLEITGLYNVSDTSAVDEQQLVLDRQRAAWVIAGAGRAYSIEYVDLRGEPEPTGNGWTRQTRWQARLTNLQETGQLAGLLRRSFRLDPAARQVELGFSERALLVDADANKIRIPTEDDAPIEGERYLREQKRHKARPGNLVTWAVDRARAMPWLGSDRMQLVKAVAFEALDWAQRVVGTVTGDDGSEKVAEELGDLMLRPPVEYTDPETGWPPPPMEPMLSPALDGEGKWRLLDDDPFIRKNPGAPAPFVTSFIRTDPKRSYSQIFVLVWDPRQVALHCMSGTVEPKSATGETGPGLVPRKPEVMGRLVAGFNGGFQATHGEFGMMADGVVYLPPKPYSATVAELSDGNTAFGTWPDSEKVPDEIVSFRQNMTPLVMDGTINPYKRDWWGGVPPGWTDESRTTRSAVCMTRENFVAYLYGSSSDADHLALAMQRARCVYGIHLDMNPGHTGLELYTAGPAAELGSLDRKLDPQWEAEGAVSGMDGWRFRGRRMLRYMGLMNFPRYISREARDFFYLTLRHVLPGEPIAARVTPPEPGEGAWKVKGLPQHGWPYAIATTWIRPDPKRPETKVRVLRVDPRTVTANDSDSGDLVLALRTPAQPAPGKPGLWLTSKGFAIAPDAPHPGAEHVTAGTTDGPAAAAAGVDAAGMLVYAEVATAGDAAADGPMLARLLKALGVGRVLLLERPLGVALGGDRDLAGHPVPAAAASVRWVRRKAPGVRRIFGETPIVAPKVWYPLQARRVRYFRKPKPDERSAEAGATEPASAVPEPAPTAAP